MNSNFEFTALRAPVVWNGLYRRIPGREPAFHALANDAIVVQWFDHDNDEQLTAKIVATNATIQLGKAINDLKERETGTRGGSFLINEFGQVLCPLAGTNIRYWVGNIKGVPNFIYPGTNQNFSLLPTSSINCNDAWKLPYIGNAYNLARNNRIYFKHDDDDGERNVWLEQNYTQLIALLRGIRGAGAIRFIVNLHGAVITKVEYTDGSWRPHFVGMIDYSQWFPKQA